MKISRILLICFTITSLTSMHADQEKSGAAQQEHIQDEIQMFLASYEAINTNCTSIKFELMKNELDQILGNYFDACITQENSTEEIVSAKQADIKNVVTRLADYLTIHQAEHNSLENIYCNGSGAAFIICYVHTLLLIEKYVSGLDNPADVPAFFQQNLQNLFTFIQNCL